MSTITKEFTKEQLIAKSREQIAFCRNTKITGEGRTHVNQCSALFEIALASLEAEPVTEWTNEQCLEFLSIAFRHAEIKGDLELDDIRLGVKMVNGSRAAMLQGDEPSPATDNTAQQFEELAKGAHREPLVVVKIDLPSHDHLDGHEREAFRKAVNICHVEFAKQCARNGIVVEASLGHDISEFESMFVGCWADNETTHQVNFVVRDDSE